MCDRKHLYSDYDLHDGDAVWWSLHWDADASTPELVACGQEV